ncbi:MAG TPA: CDP-alcohol phosphatidyltransferase family protein [Polyangia bacterium]|nr:CDP-alcohol phosphatidyltransferase family protein [Polyangia bacterium]
MRITANQVTSARLLAMPLVGFLIYGTESTQLWGVVIGTLIGLTDTVDGYLARKHGPTVLGSLLDPVADKIFIVVCYGCYADRGGIPWQLAAAIFSRELLVTVLRSSLELNGRRLPSSGIAKAKTWVQMIGFGLLVLIPILGSGRPLILLFVGLFAFALTVVAVGRLAGRPRRGFEIAAVSLAPFVVASFFGAAVERWLWLFAIVFITWYSALDYLKLGAAELARLRTHRAAHVLRLVAGAALPVIAMICVASHQLPTIAIIVLLSSDMARGALDNFAANQGVADFSWGVSLWVELALLGAALALPAVGTQLVVVAAAVAVVETLRALVRYLRAPAAAPHTVAVSVPAASPPGPGPRPVSAAPASVPDRR